MSEAMIRFELRSRVGVLLGAAAVLALVRLGFVLGDGGPWMTSPRAFGLHVVAWSLLIPAFAALLGAELAEAGPFTLARPVRRDAVLGARLVADGALLLGIAALFAVLAPVAASEALPLPLVTAFLGTWIAAHGLAAVAGAVGLSGLGAAGAGFLGAWGGLVGMAVAIELALELGGHGGGSVAVLLRTAAQVGEESTATRGAFLTASLFGAQLAMALTGIAGWWIARGALARAPLREGWTGAVGRLAGAGGAVLAGVAGTAIGLSYALNW